MGAVSGRGRGGRGGGYRHCSLRCRDEHWQAREMRMDDDMSERIQHEYDHLDGILATMRAVDNKSFVVKR